MEFYQLESFAAVVEHGSLSRAAERVFTSASVISAHIKSLEEEFGVGLFERTPRGMVLTAAGEKIFAECEEVLAGKHKLLRTAGSLRGEPTGLLRLGLINEPGHDRMKDVFDALLQRHPHVRLEFVYGHSGANADALLRRDLDACFFQGRLHPESITHVGLGTVGLCIVGPAAWARELDLSDLRSLEKKPWSHVSPGCGYYGVGQSLAQEHGLRLEVKFINNEERTALQLARDGFAFALIRESEAAPLVATGELFRWPGFTFDLPLHFGFLSARADEPLISAVRIAVENTAIQPMKKAPHTSPVRRRKVEAAR